MPDSRVSIQIDLTPFRQLRRAAQRATDAMRRLADAELRELGRGWEHPELLLEEDELEALDARALGRTLEEIDELPALR